MGITLEMGAVNGLKNDILGFSRVISAVNQRYVFSFYQLTKFSLKQFQELETISSFKKSRNI
jgi:hypothetical protein